MKDEAGIWQTDPDTIGSIFVHYYKDLLGKKVNERVKAFECFLHNGPILSITRQIELLKPFVVKDVKTALFHIDCNKNSGPDGYGSGFFKASWGIVGHDITTTILEFFQNSKLLKQINSTNIVLIPKELQNVPANTNLLLVVM